MLNWFFFFCNIIVLYFTALVDPPPTYSAIAGFRPFCFYGFANVNVNVNVNAAIYMLIFTLYFGIINNKGVWCLLLGCTLSNFSKSKHLWCFWQLSVAHEGFPRKGGYSTYGCIWPYLYSKWVLNVIAWITVWHHDSIWDFQMFFL